MITPQDVERLFTWVEPEEPKARLIKKVSDDFALLAQSVIYNVPESPERLLIIQRLYNLGEESARLIREE